MIVVPFLAQCVLEKKEEGVNLIPTLELVPKPVITLPCCPFLSLSF